MTALLASPKTSKNFHKSNLVAEQIVCLLSVKHFCTYILTCT